MGAGGDDVVVHAGRRGCPGQHGEQVAAIGLGPDGPLGVDLRGEAAGLMAHHGADRREQALLEHRRLDGHRRAVPMRGSTAPGPGAARTSLGPIGSPQAEHVRMAVEDLPAALVGHQHRGTVGGGVLVAPLAHGGEDRPQVTALVGEPVVEARGVLAVGDLGQDPGLDQPVEALVQDVPGDPESLLELVEAGHTQKGVAHDQHRPPFADDLETLRHRAVHARETLAFHALSLVSCFIERNPLGWIS